jgi:hypothetical protein
VVTDLVAETNDTDDEVADGAHGSRRPDRRLVASMLLAVNLPIVVATVRALARGWQPLGDNGILAVRSADVGTSNHPLLGSWTSASLVVGENVNNPGPLYFDLIALPIRVLGPWVGLAVGVMLLNMAASSLAVVASRRISGDISMVAVAVAVLGLQFAMGSELLFDVWQPNALVLPFLAFLVIITVLSTGDLAMAPWVLGLGSVLVQTHMSHAVLVGVLSTVAFVAGIHTARRAEGPFAWRRPAVASAIVVVVAWCQPVIEQFTGRGEGNLSRIVAASSGGDNPIGWDRASRLMVEIMARGPWFTRSAYDEAIPPTAPDAPLYAVVTMTTAVLVIVAATVALVAGGVWAWRSGRRNLAVMNAVAGVSFATAYVALSRAPVNFIALAVHQMRWLWPIAAFVTATWLATLVSVLPGHDVVRRRVMAGVAVAAVMLAVAIVPTHTSRAPGPTDSVDDLDRAQALVAQLDALSGRGTVLYDPTVLWFAEPYSGLVFAEMQAQGIPFVFDDEVFIRQFGEGRRNDGSAELRLWQVMGTDAEVVPDGAERVALAGEGEDAVGLFVEPIR